MYTVFGGGTIGYRLAKTLVDRGAKVTVVELHSERVAWLKKIGIDVIEDDMREVDLKEAMVHKARAVFVVGDDNSANMTAIHRIREDFPKVTIFARSQGDKDEKRIRKLGADIVIHIPVAISSAFVKETEDFELRLETNELVSVLDGSKPDGVAIFCHDNPDPDTLASAWALHHICEDRRVKASIFFGGDLVLPSSKEMVKRLRIPVQGLSGPEEVGKAISSHSKIALVDSGRAGENNCLPVNVVPNIIIDHHSTSATVKGGEFYEIRSNVGATSTIMTKYFIRLGLPIDLRIATALFYGIKTDTGSFTKNVSPADLMAAAFLSSYVYKPLLDIFEAPPISSITIDAYGSAITTREIKDKMSISSLGVLPDRSHLPLVVDFMMQEEGVETVILIGLVGDTVQLSARNKDKDIHIGEVLHRAFKGIGSAGGHATSAGGQVPIKALGTKGVEETIEKVKTMIYNALA